MALLMVMMMMMMMMMICGGEEYEAGGCRESPAFADDDSEGDGSGGF